MVAPTAQPSRAIHGCTDVTVNHLRSGQRIWPNVFREWKSAPPSASTPVERASTTPTPTGSVQVLQHPTFAVDHLVRSLSFTLRVHPRVLTILNKQREKKKHTVHNSGCERESLWRWLKCPLFSSSGRARRASSSLLPLLHSIPFHLLRFSAPPPFRRATALRAPALPFTAPPGVMPLSRWKAKHGFGRSHAAVFSRRAGRLDKKKRAPHLTIQCSTHTQLLWFGLYYSPHTPSLSLSVPPGLYYDPLPANLAEPIPSGIAVHV
jgi:hypothetical protein